MSKGETKLGGSPSSTGQTQIIPVTKEAPSDRWGHTQSTQPRPTLQASLTLAEYSDDAEGKSLAELAVELGARSREVSDGDMGQVEAMLVAQASILDAIFNTLARRAARTDYPKHIDMNLRLALKAQSQSRATIDTLASMKLPHPVAIVGQANISAGPQQVNNGEDP